MYIMFFQSYSYVYIEFISKESHSYTSTYAYRGQVEDRTIFVQSGSGRPMLHNVTAKALRSWTAPALAPQIALLRPLRLRASHGDNSDAGPLAILDRNKSISIASAT